MAAEEASSGGLTPQRPGADWETYKRLLGYVADQKPWFALAFIGFLLTAAGEAGFAGVLGLLIDSYKAEQPPAAQYLDLPGGMLALVIPAAMLALAMARALGSVTGEYTLSRVSFRAIHRIRCELFAHLLLMPSAFYDRSARGHLVSRLTFTTTQLRDTTVDVLKIVIADGLRVLVYLGMMLYISWALTLTFLAIAPLVGVIVRYASRRFRSLSARIQASMGDVTHVASEAVAGYREVKIFGGEDYERERFVAASARNRSQNLKMAATKAISAQIIQLIAAAAVALLVYLMFQPNIGGDISPGSLAAYLAIAGALANPIKKLSDVNARLQRGLAAAEEIFAQIDQPAEGDGGDVDVDRVAGEIRFEDVSFSYDGSSRPVLADVSFTVRPGETVALVGRSGAGKTTLAALIARFYEPTAGRILLDGVPLDRYRLACLRRQIALVSQNVTLFNDTLANNVAYGALAGASAESVATAVRRAHAEAFSVSLPQGLDTVLGDDGVLVSGGQRQRIAIARALLKDAPVLILDEATSSLDAHSERYIQGALEEVMRGRTTIVIAHRLSTVEQADVILLVDEGRIVERGTHGELIAAGGAYADLYRSQFDNGGEAAPRPPTAAAQPSGMPVAAQAFGPLVGAWYADRFWPRLLRPFAALFAWHAVRRRRRFVAGRIPSWRAPVPVVVVGNITVGGTGKTPLVIYLARWFARRGLRAGVVARGYGGKARYPLLVQATTSATLCGDEAAMIARRGGCPVAVDPDRPRAVRRLLAEADLDVVIADDGLQHYALQRDIEIAVVDGMRGVGNGLCLPAGPLREPVSRLAECDWVVANGTASGLVARESVMVAEATALVNVVSGERVAPAEFAAAQEAVVAIAGIGNPDRFRATLKNLGLSPTLRAFPDHHRFVPGDLEVPEGTAVVVTEKDAEKIRALPGEHRHCWYVEIDMRFADPVDDILTRMCAACGLLGDQSAAAGPRS